MCRSDPWSVLGLLRFALASIVAVNHLAAYAELRWLAPVPWFGAFEAVLGFLVISGYSIGRSYLAAPGGFMARRMWRIYPIYLAAMLITLAASPQPLSPWLLFALLLNALFLNQVFTAVSFVGPAWSLSLEFWLYASTAWLARQSESRLRTITTCSFAAYCGYTCCRSLFHWPYYSGIAFGLNLAFLSYAWLVGFRLAQFPRSQERTLGDLRMFFSVHILLQTLIQIVHRIKHTQGTEIIWHDIPASCAQAATLATVWLIFRYLILIDDSTNAHGRSSAARILGDISYPLYLVHVPVFIVLERNGATDPYVYFAMALGLAWIIHEAMDRLGWPMRRSATLGTTVRDRHRNF